MHEVRQTLAIITQEVVQLEPRPCSLGAAGGLVLARGVAVDADSPPFDRALLDGYAVRGEDAVTGARLRIVGRMDAGMAGEGGLRVGAGTCVAINTGAMMPAGADAVVKVEDTKVEGTSEQWMVVAKPTRAGGGVARRGQDASKGQGVLTAGMRLGAAPLAVAAAAGVAEVWAYPRPRVAVLTTGDELVGIDAVPGPGQIRNSNGVMLEELVRSAGGVVAGGGAAWVGDDAERLRQAMETELASAEVLVVTGGMSMGTKDYVPRVLVEMGVRLLVEKVRMKPGKPFLFGTLERGGGRKYVVGLPGNPVSGFVCFVRFASPLLAQLRGETGEVMILHARSEEALPANEDREFYQPALWRQTPEGPVVRTLSWKGSADIYTLARANALLVHPPLAENRPAGTVVDILAL